MRNKWHKTVAAVAGRPEVQAAFRRIDGMLEEFAAETTAICEVPAPPFKEHARGRIRWRCVAGGAHRYRLPGGR